VLCLEIRGRWSSILNLWRLLDVWALTRIILYPFTNLLWLIDKDINSFQRRARL
jgi:hypothetical protein